MLLTEEEATSRWCPFARVALGGRLPTSMIRDLEAEGLVFVQREEKQ